MNEQRLSACQYGRYTTEDIFHRHQSSCSRSDAISTFCLSVCIPSRITEQCECFTMHEQGGWSRLSKSVLSCVLQTLASRNPPTKLSRHRNCHFFVKIILPVLSQNEKMLYYKQFEQINVFFTRISLSCHVGCGSTDETRPNYITPFTGTCTESTRGV